MEAVVQRREDFRAAAERCRQASWRVGAAAVFCSVVLLALLAVLFSPLIMVTLVLATDVLNLLVSVPDPVARVFSGSKKDPSLGPLVILSVCLSAALLAYAYRQIGRALSFAAAVQGADGQTRVQGMLVGGARRPDGSVLAEQRLVNTIEEMAVAAGLPAPAVLILDRGANAAIIGVDERQTVVLVGGELVALSRDEMQGMAAHLLATAANGDLAIGAQVLRLMVLTSLFEAGGNLFEAGGPTRAARLALALLWPTRTRCLGLLDQVAVAVAHTHTHGRTRGEPGTPPSTQRLRLRDWLAMPLVGPVALSGLAGSLIRDFFVEPLIAYTWRERKLMADATAVRLTRYPDALAQALQHMRRISHDGGLPPWVAHLGVVDQGSVQDLNVPSREERLKQTLERVEQRAGDLFGGCIIDTFPASHKRLAALQAMGAQMVSAEALLAPQSGTALWVWMLLTPLLALVVVLLPVLAVLLCFVSVMISVVFTLIPGLVLHVLLRSLA